MSEPEGRQRSRKIVMLRMGNPVTPRTLADLKREVAIAARGGDTAVVVDMQCLLTVDHQTVSRLHKTFAETIPLDRVVLFNVSAEVERALTELGMRDQYDAVVAGQRAEPAAGESAPSPAAEEKPARPASRPAPVAGKPAPPAPRPMPAGEKPAPSISRPAPAAGRPAPPAPRPAPTNPPPAPLSPAGRTAPAEPAASPVSSRGQVWKLPKKPKPQGVDTTGLAGKDWMGLRIGEEVGRGGLATVYRATQPGSDLPLAIKVLHPWYADSKAIVDQFLAEGNLGRRLDQENLVKVYGCGRHGKLHYVLLEFVPSISVLDLISLEGAIEERRSLTIVADVATALDYLEANAIIHGDVKPGNILVMEDGCAKLCDFGQASRLELDPDLGLDSRTFGTAGYTAPERTGGVKTSDPRGEIYSLGVTLYRMVAGIKPGVSGKIPLHPLHPQFLSDNTVSPTTRYFIARMTVLDVTLRYSGAREALKEIKKFLVGGREFKRDMQMFGEDYVEAYRKYMREHGTRRQKKGGTAV